MADEKDKKEAESKAKDNQLASRADEIVELLKDIRTALVMIENGLNTLIS